MLHLRTTIGGRSGVLLLVLEGIKMGAVVSVNGHVLAIAKDQFLRYTLRLPAGVAAIGNNTLAVHFSNAIDVRAHGASVVCAAWADQVFCLQVNGRFMACTGRYLPL
jgi:hypothetical protein